MIFSLEHLRTQAKVDSSNMKNNINVKKQDTYYYYYYYYYYYFQLF